MATRIAAASSGGVIAPRARRLLLLLGVACVAGCATPWYFRIDEIPADSARTTYIGPLAVKGLCLSMPDVPEFAGNAPAGQAIVGFDHWHDPGTDPFPCAAARVALVRAVVHFPLDKYDSILSAFLLFDPVRSIDRDGGRTFGQVPAASYATRVGAAVAGDEFQMLDEVPLGWRTRPVEVNVTSFVTHWITDVRPNAGFTIANGSDVQRMRYDVIPHDNNAQLAWYGNFRLRVLYNVPDNPRTPPP